MTDRHASRRAKFFRSRAAYLTEEAEREFDEARRSHLFDMADAFERAADQAEPLERQAFRVNP